MRRLVYSTNAEKACMLRTSSSANLASKQFHFDQVTIPKLQACLKLQDPRCGKGCAQQWIQPYPLDMLRQFWPQCPRSAKQGIGIKAAA